MKQTANQLKAIVIITIGTIGFLACNGSRSETEMKEMQILANKVNQLTGKLRQKESKLLELAQTYQIHGDEINIDQLSQRLSLNEIEQGYLKKRLSEERSNNYASVLKDLLATQQGIDQLQRDIQVLKSALPYAQTVKTGQTHEAIALAYLQDRGIADKNALNMISKVNLFDELAPGFEVHHYLSGNTYGTFVTQGSARISPQTMYRMAKAKANKERDIAVAQATQLLDDVTELETIRVQLRDELSQLTASYHSISQKNTELQQVNSDLFTSNTHLETKAASIFFIAGERSKLNKDGVLHKSWMTRTKLNDVYQDNEYKTLDLRAGKSLVFDAQEFGMDKIHRLELLPEHLKLGRDYYYEKKQDGSKIKLTFITPEKLKGEKVILALS